MRSEYRTGCTCGYVTDWTLSYKRAYAAIDKHVATHASKQQCCLFERRENHALQPSRRVKTDK